jgi:membrane protein implicated in regulation of membrane protease activity
VSAAKGPTDYSAQPAPGAGDEIHLPGPTILPLVAAIAITLIVIGTTIDWIFSIVGAVVLVLVVIRWVRDVRRDISELPEEHH